MSKGPFLGYIFLASIPISFMRFGGHLIIPFELIIYEVILILLAFNYLIAIVLQTKRIYINLFDSVIIAFVFFSLISVIISSDELYIATRDYRHSFFAPLIAYLLFQNCFEDVEQLRTSFLYLLLATFIVSIFAFPGEIMIGARLASTRFDNVTLGVLSSWAIAILITQRNRSYKKLYKFVIYSGVMYFFFLMVFTGSRSAVIGIGISILVSFFIFKNKIYQKIFLILIISTTISFYMLMFFIDDSSLKQNMFKNDKYREVDHTITRIVSIEHYKIALEERLHLWKKAFDVGLEKPILGSGASLRRQMGRSTPHNIFISIFLTSGILGTSLFIFLIYLAYSTLFSLSATGQSFEFLRFTFVSFTILLFVGVTNDFSGGRYILFFIILSGTSLAKKLILRNS